MGANEIWFRELAANYYWSRQRVMGGGEKDVHKACD